MENYIKAIDEFKEFLQTMANISAFDSVSFLADRLKELFKEYEDLTGDIKHYEDEEPYECLYEGLMDEEIKYLYCTKYLIQFNLHYLRQCLHVKKHTLRKYFNDDELKYLELHSFEVDYDMDFIE